MLTRLIITEKPSVAMRYAAVLGVKGRQDGYLEGRGYLISWCFGHLWGLADAVAYDPKYKKWNQTDLPILPTTWQYQLLPGSQKQMALLRRLMDRADVTEIVNACDPGREGELIFRNVYNLAQCTKPMLRLWVSSMEDEAIREGFAHLRPGLAFNGVYEAALCRAQADWLVGINATRLFSTAYHRTLVIGRVISPTLSMVVNREQEIAGHKPETFYRVCLTCEGLCSSRKSWIRHRRKLWLPSAPDKRQWWRNCGRRSRCAPPRRCWISQPCSGWPTSSWATPPSRPWTTPRASMRRSSSLIPEPTAGI